MKSIITTIILLSSSIAANAQTPLFNIGDSEATMELLRSTVAIIVIFLASSFVLSLIRIILNDQLKRKMLEKGVPGEVIASMLPRKSELTSAIKWFSILTAIAVGLLIISFFPPLGIHSVIIMALSVALGFLSYYFWARKLNN